MVGEGYIGAGIQAAFTLERLEQGENFLSLLYYLGLLSFQDEAVGWTRLHIPNRTARELLHDLLRDIYDDVGALSFDQAERDLATL